WRSRTRCPASPPPRLPGRGCWPCRPRCRCRQRPGGAGSPAWSRWVWPTCAASPPESSMTSSRPADRSRTRGWRIGTLGGAPVVITAGWLLVAVVLVAVIGPWLQRRLGLGVEAYLWALSVPALLLLSVLAHELAHRSEEHTSELQSRFDLVCRLLLEK